MSGKIYTPAGKALEYVKRVCGRALNLYHGCSHGCVYCYVPTIPPWRYSPDTARLDFHTNPEPFKDVLRKVESSAKANSGDNLTVLLSFTSDAYQRIEKDLGITRATIEILHKHGHNVEILTKGGMLAARDFDLLGEGDAIAATLTFASDDAEWAEWEPNAAPPSERIEMLRQAHERGIRTWASLEPVIYPGHAVEIIEATHEFVDFYKIGKLNYIEGLPERLRERVLGVDWVRFAHDVVRVCEGVDSQFMLKDSLKLYLDRLV